MTQVSETIYIERQELREASVAAISLGIQVTAEQADGIVDQFEYAELSGKRTHGFVRVPWLAAQPLSGHEPLVLERRDGPITYADCSRSVGYLAASEITSYIRTQPHQQLAHAVVAQNIFPTNTLSYHVRELIDDTDAIGFMFGTTPRLVAGPGMDTKMLGTNPLAMGFSHKDVETITDITTASASLGELLAAKYWGGFDGTHFRTSAYTVPEQAGDLYEDGRFTGSITPNLEHHAEKRLYALNMILQMVTELIANTPDNRGNLIVVSVNKAAFNIADVVGSIDPSLLPGARSHEQYRRAAQQTRIKIPATLWRDILALPS